MMYLATFKFYSFILFSTSALENPGLSLATRIFIKDAPSSTDTHTKFFSYNMVSVFSLPLDSHAVLETIVSWFSKKVESSKHGSEDAFRVPETR